MFWNPAAVSVKGPGLNSESHYSLIVPRADITVENINGVPVAATPFASLSESGNIAGPAVTGASYGAYQFSNNLFVGMSLNSPFGLTTEPDNNNYLAAGLGRSTRLFTLNANPIVGYKVSPSLTVAAGFQAQYADGELKFATGGPFGPSSGFEGDDWAFGGTAGILYQPSPATSIGLGYRSRLSHTLEGDFYTNGSFITSGQAIVSKAEADINLPDIVTLSVRQAIASNVRVLGTVEWSNWSRFEDLTVVSQENTITIFNLAELGGPVTTAGSDIASIAAGWQDGWFFAAGLEYDTRPDLTLRAGVAYEISPVREANQRILGIPDSDRLWLSFGATAQVTQSMSVDVAYTHIVLDDAQFDRSSFFGTNFEGSVESSTDILSVSMKTRW